MKLLAIVLNYQTPEMTLRSVAALLPELSAYPDARVTIVDNDSRDGSYEKLSNAVVENGWSDRVEVIASDYNGGFAYGNNFAIRRALEHDDLPDYVYLLNSDAFPDSGCVTALVDFLDGHDDVGIAGSYVHGPEPVPHKTAFRFHSVWSELESSLGVGVVSKLLDHWIVAPPLPEQTCRVDWLAGASMLIRTSVLEAIGLLDEEYFLYYEETDFCLRAKRAGWPTWYVVESSVTHIGSASTGLKDKERPTPLFWFASRRHFFLKSYGRLALWTANVLYVLGSSLRRLRDLVQRRPTDEYPNHLWDFVRFNFRPTPHPKERYRPVPRD
jgi:hypothetical protein